jgi:hypothetical protein
MGCATTVVPPRAVQEPVKVHLADHGRHASLVLPRGDGSRVEYTFGEWRWFALNDTGAGAALRALCWRSAGTLGRHELPAEQDIGASPRFAGVTLYSLTVERGAASNLLARLDERWAGQAHTVVHNADYGLDFVRDEQAYHLFNNCNPVIAGWLRELGCRVRGPALLSRWRLRPAPPETGSHGRVLPFNDFASDAR